MSAASIRLASNVSYASRRRRRGACRFLFCRFGANHFIVPSFHVEVANHRNIPMFTNYMTTVAQNPATAWKKY
jgi:hypothetical protein